jgi:hypothetical protein
MVGETYTIVDMAVWGWARSMPVVLGEAAWAKFPNLKRLVDEISARPAGQSRGTAGKAQIQDRNGRRGAPGHVPAHEREGRVGAAFLLSRGC